MFLSEVLEFPTAPCLAGKQNLMTARVSMLLISRASLTCFRAVRAKDFSAPDVYTHIFPNNPNEILPFCFHFVLVSIPHHYIALLPRGLGFYFLTRSHIFESVAPLSQKFRIDYRCVATEPVTYHHPSC